MGSRKPAPLNGTETHPLSDHAKNILEALRRGPPIPCSDLNPGTINRLLREGCVGIVEITSPFKTHRGRSIKAVAWTTTPPPSGESHG